MTEIGSHGTLKSNPRRIACFGCIAKKDNFLISAGVGGESRIPYGAWSILRYEAGFGLIWRSEGLEKGLIDPDADNPEA